MNTLVKQTDGDKDLPTSPGQLLARLDELGIAYTLHHHEAVYTVAESEKLDRELPGLHCRNLFLRDKKKQNYLVVLQNATQVDLKKLPPVLDSDRLSFGSSERLWEFLGVRPGSVCPFAIINDASQDVKICLDKSMMEGNLVNYHPLLNTMTVALTPSDLIRFIENCGHTPHIMDMSVACPDDAC